jgi:hypothetical protein
LNASLFLQVIWLLGFGQKKLAGYFSRFLTTDNFTDKNRHIHMKALFVENIFEKGFCSNHVLAYEDFVQNDLVQKEFGRKDFVQKDFVQKDFDQKEFDQGRLCQKRNYFN